MALVSNSLSNSVAGPQPNMIFGQPAGAPNQPNGMQETGSGGEHAFYNAHNHHHQASGMMVGNIKASAGSNASTSSASGNARHIGNNGLNFTKWTFRIDANCPMSATMETTTRGGATVK
uniref:Uncharacterized protein n=1 Tax=Ditylenchus dipsaci TaxID=166011 RepID=A0A915D635_9BILA